MKKLIITLFALLMMLPSWAENTTKGPLLHFSVVAEKEVPMDILQVRLFLQQENTQLQPLHKSISEKLNRALVKIKAQSAVTIQQNGRQTRVRYNDKGQQNGWIERADLLLESRDFGTLSLLVDELSELLSIDGVQAKLSQQAQDAVGDELTKQALLKFTEKAKLSVDTLNMSNYKIISLDFGKLNSQDYDENVGQLRALSASANSAPKLEGGSANVKTKLNATIELEP